VNVLLATSLPVCYSVRHSPTYCQFMSNQSTHLMDFHIPVCNSDLKIGSNKIYLFLYFSERFVLKH